MSTSRSDTVQRGALTPPENKERLPEMGDPSILSEENPGSLFAGLLNVKKLAFGP